jgi:hypothetical protein
MSKPGKHHLVIPCVLILLAAGLGAWAASRPAEISFAQHMIDPGAYETCAVADINRDGHPDIVSGENWYEGPNWIQPELCTKAGVRLRSGA